MLPVLSELFTGVEDASFLTLIRAAGGDKCGGVGRVADDFPSNQYSFGDSGFHEDYWDGGNNQIFHVWPYIANVGGKFSFGGVGLSIAQFCNTVHEIGDSWINNGNAPGSSWEDYFMAHAGMEIGVSIANGEIAPSQLANYINWRLGPNGPGSSGMLDNYYLNYGPLNTSP